MKLREKLLQNSTIEETAILGESKFYEERDMVQTDYPMVNVALAGSITGGLMPGITQLCGPSKHFKSMFALLLASAYLKKHPDSVMLFYDSEFGTPPSYFEMFDIATDRVVHSPLVNVEKLKIDAVGQLEKIERGDKVVVVIDSVGSLASKKELDDAIAGKSVADVGARAKALKSFFRMVQPYFPMKDLPCIVVNHSYQTLEMFSKQVVGGGTGSIYSSDNIWMLGRRQEKEEKDVIGYHFIINVEKSRYVKEKSVIPITVMHDGGIQKWSGMLDLAIEAGYVEKAGHSLILRGDSTSKKHKRADIVNNDEFWNTVLEHTDFATWIKNKYSLERKNNG
jgi:RecA/RadA recombinase